MAKSNRDSRAGPQGLHIAPPPRDSGEKPLFRVVYTIDVDGSSPRDAAGKAHEMMKDPASMPPILDVLDHGGNLTTVDLSKTDGVSQDASKAICAGKRPYSREWKCPACGRTANCSYEDLAEVGCPYCADCDSEMMLA